MVNEQNISNNATTEDTVKTNGTPNTNDTVKEIKRSFRLYMNGVTAQSMRDKGVEYHINWGASLLHLRDMASNYTPDYDLAVALWKEDIRECKILATMLMPKDKFPSDLAWVWIEQLRSKEITELFVTNLLQHESYASDLAFQLFAEEGILPRICGFSLITCLFKRNMEPNERDINEFIDQAISSLQDDSLPLRHTVIKAIQHFADLGDTYRKIAIGAMKPLHLEDWVS